MSEGLTPQQIEEFREAFQLFDKDGSGSIDTEEIGQVMRALGQNPTEAELKHIIQEIDQDGNGSMDFNEFLSLMRAKMTFDYDMAEIQEAFRIFDHNGDGVISMVELRRVAQSVGERFTEQEFQEMYSEVDTDKDGKITFEDFANVLKGI